MAKVLISEPKWASPTNDAGTTIFAYSVCFTGPDVDGQRQDAWMNVEIGDNDNPAQRNQKMWDALVQLAAFIGVTPGATLDRKEIEVTQTRRGLF